MIILCILFHLQTVLWSVSVNSQVAEELFLGSFLRFFANPLTGFILPIGIPS